LEIVPLEPVLEPGEDVPVDEDPVPLELPLLLVPDCEPPLEVFPETVLPETVVDPVELPLPPGEEEPGELVPLDDEPADAEPVPDVPCPDEPFEVLRVFFAASVSLGNAIVAAATANPANTPNTERRVSERGMVSSG